MLCASNVCSRSRAAQPVTPDQVTADRAIDDNLLSFIQEAEEHRGYLTWVAARIAPAPEEVEDIVQQALLKAFVNLSRFRGEATMRTWLHAIVLNTAREHLRNRNRRVPLQQGGMYDGADEDILCDLPHPQMSPEEIYEQNEMSAILRAEIGMLTPACKHALEMRVVRDLPHQAIADALNTNVATVKSRVHRAKAMLRGAMELRMLPRNRMPPRNRIDELEEISTEKRAGQPVPMRAKPAFPPGIAGKLAHAMQ